MSRLAELARGRTWAATAATWISKASARLGHLASEADSAEERWLVGYYAETLLRRALDAAGPLVDALDDDQVEDALADARRLAGRLRARQLASKMENVSGRTPEEAEAFLARAAQLRGQAR